MKSLPHRYALLCSLLGSLLLVPAARATTSADIALLRSKAEKGNAIAQYNLGLAYADRNEAFYDPVEAYVWLNLAASKGTTGKALAALTDTITPAQIAAGRQRLALLQAVPAAPRSDASASPIASSASPIVSAPDVSAEADQLRTDKKQLSEELSSSWKETENLKSSFSAQLAEANKRIAIAQSALANKDKEIASLQAQLATATVPPPPADTSALDALRRERDQLNAAVAQAGAERATLQEKLTRVTAALAAAQNAQNLAETEAASLKAADKASAERLAIAQSALASKDKEIASLQAQLAAATVPPPPADTSALDALRRERDQLSSAVAQAGAERATLQ